MNRISLRLRLLFLIVGVLMAVLVPLGIYSFVKTVNEVRELLDGRLAQDARTLAFQMRHLHGTRTFAFDAGDVEVPVVAKERQAATPEGRTYENEVGFLIYDLHGRLLLASKNMAWLPPPTAADAGFTDMHHGKHDWRLFTLVDDGDGYLVRMAERRDSRRGIARSLLIEHGTDLLLGLPLLVLLTGWAITRGLRPLIALTDALHTRAPGSRQPVVLQHAPAELTPVVDALNGQLARLEDAIERERRFSADVAHELRTPLASSMIHLDNVASAPTPMEAERALANARRGLDTLARRVEQLLALARIEAGAAHPRVGMDLPTIVLDVIDELAPLITSADVELAFACEPERIHIDGYEAAITALIRNLLDNAMRHVPHGGRVTLLLTQTAEATLIEVLDNGPGIPAERRDSVFKRFYREQSSRGDGYGLGLSIVQRAADLHGASIELADAPQGTGLCVRVRLPHA